MTDPLQPFIDALNKVLDDAAAVVTDFLRANGVIPPPPPTDPRERSLWLRQNRNTGPRPPADWRKR